MRPMVALGGIGLAAVLGLSILVFRQNQQIIEELKATRQLLENPAAVPSAGAPAAGPVTLTLLPTDRALGLATAPLTLVEFTDVQCPFCRQFHLDAFERLKKEYVETGQLRFITRDLPLDAIHPLARSAARVSRCAGEQGKFWEMRHALLLNGNALQAEMFVTFAQDLGLDVARMITCTNDRQRLDATIAAEEASARDAGLEGTPNFVLGRAQGNTLTGEVLAGALPFNEFDSRIKSLLAVK